MKSWKIWQKTYPIPRVRFGKKWVILRRNLPCSVGYYSFHIHSVVMREYWKLAFLLCHFAQFFEELNVSHWLLLFKLTLKKIIVFWVIWNSFKAFHEEKKKHPYCVTFFSPFHLESEVHKYSVLNDKISFQVSCFKALDLGQSLYIVDLASRQDALKLCNICFKWLFVAIPKQ